MDYRAQQSIIFTVTVATPYGRTFQVPFASIRASYRATYNQRNQRKGDKRNVRSRSNVPVCVCLRCPNFHHAATTIFLAALSFPPCFAHRESAPPKLGMESGNLRYSKMFEAKKANPAPGGSG